MLIPSGPMNSTVGRGQLSLKQLNGLLSIKKEVARNHLENVSSESENCTSEILVVVVLSRRTL
jgi:hypothetical protein